MSSSASSLTVCILTAGRGTRMGVYGESLNKALLPIDKIALISHIVRHFPPDTEFVIATGHKAEQVETYLPMAHPNTKFIFAPVDKFQGPGSGPGYSLQCCKEFLQKPFFFVACDTMWVGAPSFPTDCDWFGVAEVPESESNRYCNFEIDTFERIVAIHDKKSVSGERFKAFVGLCFVKSFEAFWNSLSSGDIVAGEHQISAGISALVATKQARAVHVNWIDAGDHEKYERAVSEFENFNFSKPNESLYIVDGRVIKYFADEKVAEMRVQRARQKSGVFPEVSAARRGFYSYELVPGGTLYHHCTPALFSQLLDWLHHHLWSAAVVPPAELSARCNDFYKTKTSARIAAYFKKYPLPDTEVTINEQPVAPLSSLLERIPWSSLLDADPVFFHGDLQFDNILYSTENRKFTLLDWRQDFGGEPRFGDRYYDLGKLLGGTILNYDYIKEDLFDYQEQGSVITLDYAQRIQGARYAELLKEYVLKHKLDWFKVKLLVPIIFLNMSPLHHYPFDKFLFALGKLMLQTELDRRG